MAFRWLSPFLFGTLRHPALCYKAQTRRCRPAASASFSVVTAVAAVEVVAVEPAGSAARERKICRDYPTTISMEMMYHSTTETRHLTGIRDILPVAETVAFCFYEFFFFFFMIPFLCLYILLSLNSLCLFLDHIRLLGNNHGAEVLG
jgi:hypothetical protein